MSRQRQKGTRFETAVARFLTEMTAQEVERRAQAGANDKGDVRGLRSAGGLRIAVECKNCQRLELASWLKQARVEAANAGDDVGVVVFHAKGKGESSMGDQYVLMGLDEFVRLIGATNEKRQNAS